ncbi:VanW family protein [Myceligenerans crystallogenes]|uniref:VanW family protein n=1 Tax=Myceligenerans crystallogenes TaxID=316335 RepID=UPI0031D94708
MSGGPAQAGPAQAGPAQAGSTGGPAPTGPSSSGTPASGDEPGDQAALLQSVVDNLRPEQSAARPEAAGGYQPRVFAFDDADRDPGSGNGAPRQEAARPAAAAASGPASPASAAPASPSPAAAQASVPPADASAPPASMPPARQTPAPASAAAAAPASGTPASVPPPAGAPTVPPAGEPATIVPPSPGSPGEIPAAAPPADAPRFSGTAPVSALRAGQSGGTQPLGGPQTGQPPFGQPGGGPQTGQPPFGQPGGGPQAGQPPFGQSGGRPAGAPGAASSPNALPHGVRPPGGPYGAPGPQAGAPGSAAPGQILPPPNFPGSFGPQGGAGAPKRRAPVKTLLAVGLGVVAVVAAFAILAGVQAGAVPGGTTVAGIDIGGKSRDEAVAALDEGLAKRSKKSLVLVAGETESKLDPAKSGLAYDAEATVDGLTGFSLDPVRMWQHLSGSGGEEDLVLAVDDKLLKGAVESLSENMTVKPADGAVEFTDGVPRATDARKGSTLDAQGATAVITENWLVSQSPYTLPTKETEADITQAEVDAAMTQAEKVISASVEVRVEGYSVELTPADLAANASFAPDEGTLKLRFDRDALVDTIGERAQGLLTIPEDAHFEFQGGRPVVVGGGAGTTLDAKEVGERVNAAARGDDRVAEVKLHEQDPEDTKKALEELGVNEIVSEFSTPLTDDNVRTQNLIRGAEMITGNLVKPGETFSLIEALSPITEANGYVSSGIVSEGKHVEGVGGGLSQMATTSYNAGYFAGYDDVEHRQHSFWFPRYPAGREATIYVGALDMKFTNDTPYGAVLESFVSGGQLTVRLWSTKHYTVQTSDTGQQAVVKTSPVKSNDPECVAYPGGENGFTITNFRKVSLNGELVKDEQYTWTYKPDNPVECTKGGGGDGGD